MMNKVILYGRLAGDVTLRYTSDQKAVANFTIAIDRGKDKNGESKGADFPNVVCFGKTAENCERYLAKGRSVIIDGRIQTRNYESDGRKVYVTEVIAERVDFVGRGDKSEDKHESADAPNGFSRYDADIPF